MVFDRFYKALDVFTAVLAGFAASLILGMSLWTTWEVLARYFFDVSTPWTFDLSEYSLVWITFLGAPWVLMQDRHVRIEILVDILPTSVQRMLGIIVCIVALLACAVMAWRTGIAALQYINNDVMMPRIWRIPRIWPYWVIPAGSALLALVFVARLGLYLREDDPEAVLKTKASAGQEDGLSTDELDPDQEASHGR